MTKSDYSPEKVKTLLLAVEGLLDTNYSNVDLEVWQAIDDCIEASRAIDPAQQLPDRVWIGRAGSNQAMGWKFEPWEGAVEFIRADIAKADGQ